MDKFVETFEAVAKDKGDADWTVMASGSPRACKTKVVVEAGFMAAQPGYEVVGYDRKNGITVRHDGNGTETVFRIRKVVERTTKEA